MKARPMTLAILAVLLLSAPAYAVPISFFAVLSGAAEATPNASPGTGTALVTWDDVAHTLQIDTTFGGLLAPNTAAHIHCCTMVPLTGTAGVATTTPTFTGFPSGTSGTYSHLFDLTDVNSFSAGFVTASGGTAAGAEAALIAGMLATKSYFNRAGRGSGLPASGGRRSARTRREGPPPFRRGRGTPPPARDRRAGREESPEGRRVVGTDADVLVEVKRGQPRPGDGRIGPQRGQKLVLRRRGGEHHHRVAAPRHLVADVGRDGARGREAQGRPVGMDLDGHPRACEGARARVGGRRLYGTARNGDTHSTKRGRATSGSSISGCHFFSHSNDSQPP